MRWLQHRAYADDDSASQGVRGATRSSSMCETSKTQRTCGESGSTVWLGAENSRLRFWKHKQPSRDMGDDVGMRRGEPDSLMGKRGREGGLDEAMVCQDPEVSEVRPKVTIATAVTLVSSAQQSFPWLFYQKIGHSYADSWPSSASHRDCPSLPTTTLSHAGV